MTLPEQDAISDERFREMQAEMSKMRIQLSVIYSELHGMTDTIINLKVDREALAQECASLKSKIEATAEEAEATPAVAESGDGNG